MAGLYIVPIDEVVFFDICTHSPTTGAVADADSTPTFSVFEEDTDTAILSAQNFVKRTSLTGDYRGTFTASAANGFEAGKWYNVIASATVGAVTAKTPALIFRCCPAEAVAGVPKGDVVAIGGDMTSATNLAASAAAIVTGVVGSGSSTTSIVLASISVTPTDASQFNGRSVLFPYNTTTTGLRCQPSIVTGSTTGATPALTVSPALTSAPASGDLIRLV